MACNSQKFILLFFKLLSLRDVNEGTHERIDAYGFSLDVCSAHQKPLNTLVRVLNPEFDINVFFMLGTVKRLCDQVTVTLVDARQQVVKCPGVRVADEPRELHPLLCSHTLLSVGMKSPYANAGGALGNFQLELAIAEVFFKSDSIGYVVEKDGYLSRPRVAGRKSEGFQPSVGQGVHVNGKAPFALGCDNPLDDTGPLGRRVGDNL